MDAGRLFAIAWKVVPRLPDRVARGIFDAVALGAHAARIEGVRQLERNLARIVPGADARELRRLSRAGMRSYMRYYCETFQLVTLTRSQLDARVRGIGHERYAQEIASGRAVVVALGHTGNWDLAGAWAPAHLGHVVTVAETLEPESLFAEFLAFRESLGMTIVPYRKGAGVFRDLLRLTRSNVLVPLLADRDLSHDGVEVTVAGHPMRVAPGAAALAQATSSSFAGVFIRYERLRGARRRAAGSPWGIVVEFGHPISPPPPESGLTRAAATAQMMQAWAEDLTEFLRRHPQDWHMLQKVFTSDLDPERLARAAARDTRRAADRDAGRAPDEDSPR